MAIYYIVPKPGDPDYVPPVEDKPAKKEPKVPTVTGKAEVSIPKSSVTNKDKAAEAEK